MEIIKEKYTLREWQLTDIESLVNNANNIHIWRNMTDLFPHPYKQQDAESFIRMNMEKSGFTKFGMSHQSAIKEGKFVDMPYYELLKYPILP